MPDWVIWLIVAIVVVALVALLLVVAGRKKKERDRGRAGELREQAAAQATGVQKRQASAKETEAEAAAARAEADRKQAEAERLAAEADERRRAADAERERHEEHLRRADELDPDVDTRSDDYAGPDARTATTGQAGRGDDTTAEPTRSFTEPDGSVHRGVEPEGESGTTAFETRGGGEREAVQEEVRGDGRTGGGSHAV